MNNRVQSVFRWLMLAVLFISSGAMAATLDVLVDRDNNTATGCSVTTPGGAFGGVEQIFTTTVDTTVFPARITGISRQDCLTPPATFSASIPVDAGGWPVGVGIGTNGYDVVESYFTVSQQFGQYRLGFVYKDPNTGQDALLTVNGQAGAAAIIAVIGPTPIIPTLTHGALLLLAFALGWLALRQLRRHRASTLIVVGVLASILAGTALAAVVLDGLIADWSGVAPIATDPTGDAPAGADIAAVFIQVEAGRVYVRLDVKIATPPSITSANATTLIVGAAGSFSITTFGIPPVNAITETGALPAGVGFVYTAGQSTASLSGTPGANTGGVYPLLLTAKNGVTPDATQNFTLTVNQAPAITSANTTTCFVGVACTFSVTATGYPAPAISRGGASLPSGITYVDNGNGSGTLSGIADLGTVGPYVLSFTAANGVGVDAAQNFVLTVAKATTTTTIASSQNPALVGQPVTFTATVTAQGNGTPGGQVQFKDGASNLGAPVAIDGTGKATLTTSTLTLGAHTITVNYLGDPNFTGSTGSLPTQTVNKASSTTTVTSSVNPSTSGQSVVFTATVIATPPGSGTPTGTVQFMDGGANLGAPVALNGGGVATLATTSLAPGAHAITANYSGDANFSTSSGSLPTQTVNKANTTTTLARTTGPDPSVFGQPLTFTATIAAVAPGAGTPTGTVTFKDGATTLCNAVALLAGVATCSTSTLPVGAHSITADYSSDANFNASTSAALPQTVNKANTTTVITNAATITATPSVVGEPYAVNVSVSPVAPGAGTPSGTINVGDGTATCTITLPATSCMLTSTSPGAKTVTASYSGDANFNLSNATSAAHTVTKASTTTTITNAAALGSTPTVIGEAYAVNVAVAAVAPGSGTPTGTVTVGDGAATCTITLPASSCSLVSTTSGAKTISAQYNADANFNGSAAAAAPHTVNKPATTTTITNAATLTSTATVVGESYAVNWSVTVNPPGTLGAALTGTVTVSDGAQSCNAAVAVGTCNLTSTSPGAKTITATYAGDPNYSGSASSGAAHTVNKAATTTTITNSLAASTVVGQAYQVNWTVAVVAPGSAAVVALTGNVSVSDGGASCTAAVGAGTCALTSTSSGIKTVVATYPGDTNYTTSASAGTAHTVFPAATTTVLTSSNNPSLNGASVTFTATISPTAPGAGVPTGTVTFRDNAALLGTAPLVGGVAQFTTSSLAPGVHPNINSNYPGDGNFSGSASGSLSQTVNQAPIAVADNIFFTLHDTGKVFPAPGVLWNDTIGTPAATITHVNGTVCAAFPCARTTTQGGNVSVNADGSFGFTPMSFFAGDDTFTYTLTNSVGVSTATVTVTVDDAAPVVDLNGNSAGIDFGPVTFNEGSGPTAIVGTVAPNALTVVDNDSANIGSATIILTNIQDAGSETLALTCPAGPAPACSGAIQTTDIAAPVITATTYTITINRIAPPSDYQALLRSLTYNHASLNPTAGNNRLITLRVDDRIKNNAPLAQATVQVVPVNNAPLLANIEPGNLSYKVSAPAAAITSTLTVADPDSANLTGATVRITTNCVSGDDVLSFANQLGISGIYSAGTCLMTLSGNAPPADYQTALRAVKYSNTNAATPFNTRTVTFQANDGAALNNLSTPVTRGVAVSTNSPPVLTAGGTLNYIENQAATAIDTTITLTDPDSLNMTGATINITGNCASGEDVLSFVNLPPITGTAGSCSMTLSGTDTLANYLTALKSVKYRNTSDNPSVAPRTVTWQVNDGAAANNLSNTPTSTINVTAVNDAPVLTAGATLAFTENGAAAVIDNTITVTDFDSTNLQSATVQITGNYQNGSETLACGSCPGLTATFAVATGTLTISNSVSLATYQAALRTVTFVNTSDNPTAVSASRTITWIGTDTAAAPSTPVTSTINITAVNDAPVLAAIEGGNLGYIENGVPIAITAALTVNDIDSTNLAGATVQITGNCTSPQDVLSFSTQNGITGTYTAASCLMTLGGSSSVANYQTALRSVMYSNTSDDPSTAIRTVTFQANDGGAVGTNLSNTLTRGIAITAVNDPPTATGYAGLPAQAGIPITYPAGKLFGTDVEAGTTITIDTTPINVTNGTASLNADGSFTFTPLPNATTGSFQYRVADNGNPGPGANSAYVTVGFTVAGPAIYFVKSVAVGSGNCTLGNECTLATALDGSHIAATTNARIFISDANNHAAAVTLNSGGWLIGQGVTGITFDSLFGIAAPAQGTLATRPSLSLARATIQNTVTINTNSTVRGLNISSTTNTGMTDPVAAITGVSVSEVAVTTSTGTGVSFSSMAGTLSFDGLTTSGGKGADLVGNPSATFSFSGVSISSGGNTGFNATGGGTVTMTGATNTIISTTGTALNVNATTIGPSGLTLRSISSNGAVNGINLFNSGAGSFTVTGNGSTCTVATPTCDGGSIQSSTGQGILLNKVGAVSLTRMKIQNSGTNSVGTPAIGVFPVTDVCSGACINGFTMDNSIITDSAGGATDDGLVLTNVTGDVSITNSAISNIPHNGMKVDNYGYNMASFTMTNSIISCAAGQPCQPSGSIGNDGLLLTMRGTSVLSWGLVSGSTFSGVRAVGVQVQTNDSGRIGQNSGGAIVAPAAQNSFTVQTSTFTDSGQGIDIGLSQISNITFQVLNNTTMTGMKSNAINAFSGAGADTGPTAHTLVGKIDGNVIGTQGTKDSGSAIGNGIRVVVQGDAMFGAVTVSNNTVREVPNASFGSIMVFTQNGRGFAGATSARYKVINNTVTLPSGTNQNIGCGAGVPCGENGIFVYADEAATTCAAVSGNTVYDVASFTGGFDVYLAERVGPPAGAQVTIESGAIGVPPAAVTYINANNALAGINKTVDEGANVSTVVSCGTFP